MNTYGWHPDPPDFRDLPYMAIRPMQFAPIELPEEVDLRIHCPPVYNQLSIGSCVAQSVVAAYEMELLKDTTLDDVSLSKLFVYYNARMLEGTVNIDAGAHIRDGVKVVAEYGACQEMYHPYVVSKFKEKPSDPAYLEALNHKAIIYAAVGRETSEICLALADGFPVIFGFTVYESFENGNVRHTGIMTMPKAGERAVGGHAVLAVGYNRQKQLFLVRNSWGAEWGQNGYFWMPFSYAQRLARDYWIIKKVN